MRALHCNCDKFVAHLTEMHRDTRQRAASNICDHRNTNTASVPRQKCAACVTDSFHATGAATVRLQGA